MIDHYDDHGFWFDNVGILEASFPKQVKWLFFYLDLKNYVRLVRFIRPHRLAIPKAKTGLLTRDYLGQFFVN